MPRNPINRIFFRMLFYGVIYGSPTSGFLFMALQLADPSNGSGSRLIWTFIYGLPVGVFVGGLAGILSGMAIIIVNGSFLPRHLALNGIRNYRLSAGVVTVCMCILVFSPLFGGLELLLNATNNIPLTGFLLSLGIAVYASQSTVTKYLRDIDVRKSKVK